MVDDSLDIVGYSNDPDPVPLFAHECVGLYEDDEIPGVDEQDLNAHNGHFFKDGTEDFNDPTLEKFPSTRDGIMSTVRKVESGRNVDQVSIEDLPLSPVAHSRSSSIAEARNEPMALDASPYSQDPQHLQAHFSLASSDERSVSAISLHSIAEDSEIAEEEQLDESQPKEIGDAAGQFNGIEAATDPAEKSDAEATEESKANEIAPVVEQAETAEEVIEAAQEVEGDQSNEIPSASNDLPSVADIPIRDISAVVELPPAVEEIGSPGEPLQDIASVIEQTDGEDDAQLAKDVGAEETTATQSPLKHSLEPLITVPSSSINTKTDLLSPVSDEDEAVVVKSPKGEDSTKFGYLTPERASTPQPEDPGSPGEAAPNTADPVEKHDLDSDAPQTEAVHSVSAPLSPQIVLSKPNATQPEEELLPAASLDGGSAPKAEPLDTIEQPKDVGSSRDIENIQNLAEVEEPNNIHNAQSPADVEGSKSIDNTQSPAEVEGAKIIEDAQSPADVEGSKSTENTQSPAEVEGSKNIEDIKASSTSKTVETPAASPAGSGNEGTSSQSPSESLAPASAAEDGKTGGLKQRLVGRPDPTDRSTTPRSISEPHKDLGGAAKNGNWFSSFMRLIFIDFVGGLVRKLSGGGRKT